MLLPLRGGTGESQLREDVRVTPVRYEEMGDDLREAAHEAAGEDSGCRAEVSTSGAQ